MITGKTGENINRKKVNNLWTINYGIKDWRYIGSKLNITYT